MNGMIVPVAVEHPSAPVPFTFLLFYLFTFQLLVVNPSLGKLRAFPQITEKRAGLPLGNPALIIRSAKDERTAVGAVRELPSRSS